MLDSTQSLESDTPKAQIEDVLFALGSVASHVGEVTGVLLVLVQLLARDRLISHGRCEEADWATERGVS